ncbi:MAG: PBP1A family penicillin-binding protein [Chitinivibrionales bacterium]|nr:PBP1A family penicillin-binding protein [Chitinivibrionales bacterium]MBD3394648.1 PBP1A family penicillin-binding protein [Chitinivibrionales bacterium]
MNTARRPEPGSAPDSAQQTRGTKGKRVVTLVLLVLFVLSLATAVGIRFLYNMASTLPSPGDLQNIQPPLVSKVYAADGSLVHEFSVERRFWVPLDRMPSNLRNAVVAIEDRRFYQHWGIDTRRILGAVIVNVVRGGYAQGASTITQQLARNVYLSFRQSLIRKIREAMTAVQIEHYYTKREILELYLNQVYLGAGVYGVEAASQRYYSKPVSELTLNECAVLAGLIQLPEHYRPDKPENLERVTKRRNAVIRAMRKMRFIDRREAAAVLADSIPSNPQKRGSKTAPYLMEMVRQHVEKTYGERLLYNGGLSIYTTLDPVAQDSAERALTEHLRTLQKRANRIFLDSTHAHARLGISGAKFLASFDSIYAAHEKEYDALPDSVRLRIVQGAVVALGTRTGAIRVLIGGRDFSESKFNRATQARRQPGSSFKAFVYTAAIDSGYTPATVVLDQPITLETPEGLWRPENYDREFSGPVTLRHAIKKSINLVAIQVLQDIGALKVIEYARLMGLTHRMNPVPALAIGACEATPMEMTSAYSIFPNGGRRAEPYFIERIFDKGDRLLEEHETAVEQIISPRTAWMMTSLLRTVVTSGTGASIPGLGFNRPAGGKTGTTNDYSDAWFVGFTPQITCGVWVGVDERRGMGHGITGSRGAIPIWVPAMMALHRELPVQSFPAPDGIVVHRICSASHKMATQYCPTTEEEYFVTGFPPDTCDVHGPRRTREKKGDVLRRFGTRRSRPREENARKKKLMF